MRIGNIIKEYRIKNNLTQTAFGKIVGVNKQTISKWEKGVLQPSTEKLFEISQAISVSIADMLKNENLVEEEGPFIYTHKIKYDVGLNSMYHRVHDFDTFCAFVDAMESAHRLLETNSTDMGFLLINMTLKDKGSHRHSIPINSIYCYNKELLIEIPQNILEFTEEKICYVESSGFFNNETYSFIIYLADEQGTFIQLVLSFN